MGFQRFVTHFLDEALSRGVVHINDLFVLGHTHVALGILSSCVANQPFYLIQKFFRRFSLVSFDEF
jgi:hypothetical protein